MGKEFGGIRTIINDIITVMDETRRKNNVWVFPVFYRKIRT